MSKNLPAIPSAQEFQTMKEMGKMAIASGLLPQAINTPEKAIIIIMKGRELGIPPMQAFSGIAVISGKPTMSAELMLSLIYKNVPGAVVNFTNTSNTECVIEAQRPGGKLTKFSFTMKDAETARLTGKGPWVTYPAAMLRARCISAMARAMFPDALSGVVYTPEELGAEIDDDGNITTIPDAPQETVPQSLIESPKSKVTGTIQAGDHKIEFGTKEKGYRGMTIAEAVERDGLPKVQQYVNRLIESCERDGKPVSKYYTTMQERLTEYAASLELARRLKEPFIGDADLSAEDQIEVERMSRDMANVRPWHEEDFDSTGARYAR